MRPLVGSGLDVIQREYEGFRSASSLGVESGVESRRWCLERALMACLTPDGGEEGGENGDGDELAQKAERKRKRDLWSQTGLASAYPEGLDGSSGVQTDVYGDGGSRDGWSDPPLILSPGLNRFAEMAEISSPVVKNTSFEEAVITTSLCSRSRSRSYATNKPSRTSQHNTRRQHPQNQFTVPPLATFLLASIAIPSSHQTALPISPDQKFNLILLDPPWSNRSVRRSNHYKTQSYTDFDPLTHSITDILSTYSHPHPNPNPNPTTTSKAQPDQETIAAIWTTNSPKSRNSALEALAGAGFTRSEEWIWVKVTVDGRPVSAIDGVWRRPWEVLVIGRKGTLNSDTGPDSGCTSPSASTSKTATGGDDGITRRLIAAVPDVHSRKPNLREVFEKVFFKELGGCTSPGVGASSSKLRYEALEVFARNLTAGWWGVGDEVLKFNEGGWWVDP